MNKPFILLIVSLLFTNHGIHAAARRTVKYKWFDGKEYGEKHFPGDDHDSVYRRGVWASCDVVPTTLSVYERGRLRVIDNPSDKQIIAEANSQINVCREAMGYKGLSRNAEEAYIAGITGSRAVINAIECSPAARKIQKTGREYIAKQREKEEE